jgi:hypothetical protein
VGKELRSLRDLTDCQEDSQGISHCQVGNGLRSLRDLIDYQEGSGRFPIFQVGKGTEMESVDSIDCQEGSRKIPYCQVGRDEQVSWNQPEELTEKMSSELDLDQQMQLTEEENQNSILMIGGIEIFLPFSQGKAEVCVADIEVATTEAERQPAVTVKEALEQVLETAQTEEGDDEHSRNGSLHSARKLSGLQHGSLQKKKKKKQTTLVWLICMSRLKPWREG